MTSSAPKTDPKTDPKTGLSPQIQRSHRLAEAFRAVLTATASPGAPQTAPPLEIDLAPLSPAATAVLAVLVDQSTPLWLAPRLSASGALGERLRFEFGAPLCADPETAQFLIGAWDELAPALDRAAIGAPERPDLSATAILEATALGESAQPGFDGARLSGAGVAPDARRELWIEGAGPELWAHQARNRARFPLGTDLFVTAGARLAALPRHSAAEPL